MTSEGRLIGTSNVNRVYDPELFPAYKPYIMRKCCNKEVLLVELSMITDETSWLILSVFENILCDTIREAIEKNTTAATETTEESVNNETSI